MKRWAMINGDVCVTVVEQETKPTTDYEWVEVTDIDVGSGWAYINGEWSNPKGEAE